jgi:protein CpxP
MKSNLTSLRFAVATSLLVGLSGLALAQTPVTPKTDAPPTERMHKMHTKMADRHAQHLTDLKAKLKLEALQEPAWSLFSQTMQTPMALKAQPDPSAWATLTTPERIDQMQVRKATHDAELLKRADVTKTFYAALKAEQKKIFDNETAHTLRDMAPMRGHKGGHHPNH